MSTQATVRNIAAPHNGIGIVYREELPKNVIRCESKYCEICGKSFVRPFAPTEPVMREERDPHNVWGRKITYGPAYVVERRRDHGQRFCAGCRGRSLEPDTEAQERYKIQLPTEREARKNRAYGMPDYRNLNPVGRATAAHKVNASPILQRRCKRILSQLERDKWQACVKALLRERPATMEELCELIPNATTPQDASIRLRYAAISLRRVGNAPRRAENGPYPGLFVLASETIH